ncbi:MAG: family 16 glycosylhydrolase [Bacteroidota bacterium]|nr:family 16 glycosylhydrolase [Bacteroidota bacterium]
MKTFLPIFLAVILIVSCSSKPDFKFEPLTLPTSTSPVEADFTFTPKNISDSSNYIVLSAKIKGTYQLLEWTLPDRTVQKDVATTYYFPKKGTYSVTLKVWQTDGTVVTTKKNIVIASDDPAYVPFKLIWSEEFSGNSLNTKDWTNETKIDVNNEWQRYTDGENLSIHDGILTITAQKIGEGQKKYDYTSGRINTSGKREFLYGRFEIRAKMPVGRGTWPATWMLGANVHTVGWPACGELDIMEHVGYDPLWIQGSIHTPSSYGNTINSGRLQVSDCEGSFHVYGMTWTPDKIEYYVDNPETPYYTYKPAIKTSATWPFDKPFYIILNLAIGGNWGGAKGVDDSIFPVEMQVDYVRVYNYQ